jgi:DNA-binding CsgD family transcriptional regulator
MEVTDRSGSGSDVYRPLTPREQEIADLVARGAH